MSLRKTFTLVASCAALTCSGVFAEEITVSAWGGFFEETLKEVIYPGFTEETGITVRSIAQPADQAWLTQLTNAARAKKAPADLSLVADEVFVRGQSINLWANLNADNIPNTQTLLDGFTKTSDDGNLNAVGALSWFTTFVTNTDTVAEAPTSWADLWTRDWDGKLGLTSNANSGLMEATALTFFGGYDVMETREGLEKVIAKIAELKPQVQLWYRDEGQFQQSLEAGELVGGLYYHDVTMLSAMDGLPVVSTFPKEGGILGDAYWIVPRDSKNIEAAEKFINYMIRPDVQAEMARNLGVAPVAKRDAMDLTDEEFASVGSSGTPIRSQTHIHLREGDWLSDKYLEMISQ
ncbi:extracellular solute-binding protein [Shimia thalassica]|uniref:ABC transporter substrate-binding protein n=1 Tax=Shimia thalassica TaxID=1715693 RepID=UPI001C09BB4C|nr:extracellular solute-binding protein [Shimia thalassica]MBU2942902.1 extracellular solute-binding protein [Shimia thalassica]MDO6502776.1 extracellular solute-binding protein [Shimia thalassica]MDO6520391.1 extracellular solute-binding protein [Shimia thalassica]